jgi:hypothetical protein
LAFLRLTALPPCFCRALNYDMFFEDLSNPRVFADTDRANVLSIFLQNSLRFAVFSRALNYDTEKSDLSTFKKLFSLLSGGQVLRHIHYLLK